MTQLRLPKSALDAMTIEEREVFDTQFENIRLGEPAPDYENKNFVVWDDSNLNVINYGE